MYHRIATETVDPWGLAVTAERFEQQVTWLQGHRTVLPLTEFARLHAQSRLPSSAVVITFDDGYACNAHTAAPILEAHRAPATFFLTTGPIARGEEFWWDDLQRIVFEAQLDRLELSSLPQSSWQLGDATGGRASWAPLAPPTNRRQVAFLELWRVLRSLEPLAQAAALRELREQSTTPVTPRATHRPMTVTELRRLSQSQVIDIGCHTVSHPALTERSVDVQRAEIDGSRTTIAALTGRVPTTFAYPFGDVDSATVEVVRQEGFEAACTTNSVGVTAHRDVLALPRLQMEDWSPHQLARILGAF